MKRATLITALLLLAIKIIISQTIINESYQSGLWTQEQSPFHVYGNVTIHEDSMLQIEPGVDIIFQGHYCMDIIGVLKANGAFNDSICFF
jgi:hypothetical protein